jgi:hypothetical protein
MIHNENELLKQENRMLREKVMVLEEEIDRLSMQRPHEGELRML